MPFEPLAALVVKVGFLDQCGAFSRKVSRWTIGYRC
jgi:hypothetical protein